ELTPPSARAAVTSASISPSGMPKTSTTKLAAPPFSYSASTSACWRLILCAKTATARMANASAAVAKTHLTHARRRSTMASQTRARCTQRLSQLALNVLTQLPEHATNGSLHLGGGPAALELAAERVKQQLLLACFARRDQRRDLVPVGARLIKLGLGRSRVP